jgi:hypothetical protein
MNYKILKPHVDDCYAIKNTINGTWPTPWAYIDLEKREYRDSIGRLNRNGRRWHRIRCNCTYCPAEVIVPEVHFLTSIPSGGLASRRKVVRK